MSINSSTARRSQTKSVAMPKYQQAASSDAGLEAGDNEPYEDDEDFDFSIEVRGEGANGGVRGAGGVATGGEERDGRRREKAETVQLCACLYYWFRML